MKKTFAQLKNIFTNVREKKKKNIQKQLTLNWADVKQDLYSLEEFLEKIGPNQIWRINKPASVSDRYFFTGPKAHIIEKGAEYITLSDGGWSNFEDDKPYLTDQPIPSYIALHDFPITLIQDTNESLNLDWAFTDFTFIPHKQWAAEIKDAIVEKKILSYISEDYYFLGNEKGLQKVQNFLESYGEPSDIASSTNSKIYVFKKDNYYYVRISPIKVTIVGDDDKTFTNFIFESSGLGSRLQWANPQDTLEIGDRVKMIDDEELLKNYYIPKFFAGREGVVRNTSDNFSVIEVNDYSDIIPRYKNLFEIIEKANKLQWANPAGTWLDIKDRSELYIGDRVRAKKNSYREAFHWPAANLKIKPLHEGTVVKNSDMFDTVVAVQWDNEILSDAPHKGWFIDIRYIQKL